MHAQCLDFAAISFHGWLAPSRIFSAHVFRNAHKPRRAQLQFLGESIDVPQFELFVCLFCATFLAGKVSRVVTDCARHSMASLRAVSGYVLESGPGATLGEGTFGSVIRGTCTTSGDRVAIKLLRSRQPSWAACLALREVRALARLSAHENIVRLRALVWDAHTRTLAFVFDLAGGTLLDVLMARRAMVEGTALGVNGLVGDGICIKSSSVNHAPAWLRRASPPQLASGLLEEEARAVSTDLLRGLAHVHRHGYFHRDVKPENVLVVGRGPYAGAPAATLAAVSLASGAVVCQLCDFGQARETRSTPPYSPGCGTAWYRAPEVAGGASYSAPVDSWAAGAVLAELFTGRPLAPGADAPGAQLAAIFAAVGPPPLAGAGMSAASDSVAPLRESLERAGASPAAADVVAGLLQWDPALRLTPLEALAMPFFATLPQPPAQPTADCTAPSDVRALSIDDEIAHLDLRTVDSAGVMSANDFNDSAQLSHSGGRGNDAERSRFASRGVAPVLGTTFIGNLAASTTTVCGSSSDGKSQGELDELLGELTIPEAKSTTATGKTKIRDPAMTPHTRSQISPSTETNARRNERSSAAQLTDAAVDVDALIDACT